MDIGLWIGIVVYGFVMFKIGRSYGYSAARDDLKNKGQLSDTDD
jgi:hypothetical protein